MPRGRPGDQGDDDAFEDLPGVGEEGFDDEDEEALRKADKEEPEEDGDEETENGTADEGGEAKAARIKERTGAREAFTLSSRDLQKGLNDALLDRMHFPDDYAALERARPRTRGDCKDGIRPCPFAACKHHLLLDVNKNTGSIVINFPDAVDNFELLPDTCALDVADRAAGSGGITLEEVGAYMNVTRERIRQLETVALNRVRSHAHRIEDAGNSRMAADHVARLDEDSVRYLGGGNGVPATKKAPNGVIAPRPVVTDVPIMPIVAPQVSDDEPSLNVRFDFGTDD